MRNRCVHALALCSLSAALTTAALAQGPPAVELRGVGNQAGFGDLLVLGPGGHLEVVAPAGQSLVRLLDGKEVAAEAFAGPWTPGAHTAAAALPSATGEPLGAGPPLHFVYDPQAPTLQ